MLARNPFAERAVTPTPSRLCSRNCAAAGVRELPPRCFQVKEPPPPFFFFIVGIERGGQRRSADKVLTSSRFSDCQRYAVDMLHQSETRSGTHWFGVTVIALLQRLDLAVLGARCHSSAEPFSAPACGTATRSYPLVWLGEGQWGSGWPVSFADAKPNRQPRVVRRFGIPRAT